MQNLKIKELRKKAMSLPLTPGVYIMKNKSNDVIYIGKAKALKKRVSQYFGSQNNHSDKVRKMVENVDDFDYILTDSEYEALILECSLIKQHMPKYNILLKDDKGYSYIKISKAPWSKITAVKQITEDGSDYLGPYYSSYYVKNAVEEANKIFKLPTCNRRFPQEFGKGRPCLNYHIKQCSAPCRGRISQSEYQNNVNDAISFLKSGGNISIKDMESRMLEASENMEYELAAKLRDRINAVKKMTQKQKVVSVNVQKQDIISFAGDSNLGCFSVIRFDNGRLYDKEDFVIREPGDVSLAMSEFLERYYMIHDSAPPHIYVNILPEGYEILQEWLTQKAGKKAYISVPRRGEQAQLIAMCKNNAIEQLAQQKGYKGSDEAALEELSDLLGLEKIPEFIESYDISNLSGENNVAGMIVFRNGKPYKQAYRKFEIKGFAGQDDYASMAEVLTRRFDEYIVAKNNGNPEGFGRLPDLILLDGGKGQVSAVRPVLQKYGLDIPLFGMVKDNKHRTRAITTEGKETEIISKRKAFTLISQIQEEVHRFAISYHRQKRDKKTFKSSLTQIDGIGETRAKALLKYFKTISRISQADIEELENAPTMTKPAAVTVYNYFHKRNNE
ncbi:MAG: excinuclease ABC subunit UvrC [Clostridiales bacterium]|nr:excinuclease ABC subunit UvrC [Clostridiales bacterium]